MTSETRGNKGVRLSETGPNKKVRLSETGPNKEVMLQITGFTLEEILELAGITQDELRNNILMMKSPLHLTQESLQYEIERRVSDVLNGIGVPAHVRGYQYLKEAIIMVINDRDLLKGIGKRVYIPIGMNDREYRAIFSKDKNSDAVAQKVGRAMRHAIILTWKNGEFDTLEGYFKSIISDIMKYQPTPMEFIAIISERIRAELKL